MADPRNIFETSAQSDPPFAEGAKGGPALKVFCVASEPFDLAHHTFSLMETEDPQRLKPGSPESIYGTTEVVPSRRDKRRPPVRRKTAERWDT